MNIAGLNKTKVLQVLYANARVQGLGVLHARAGGLSDEEAEQMMKEANETGYRFDYVRGRVMKVNLTRDTLDPRLYDQDNGEGTALAALRSAFPNHLF